MSEFKSYNNTMLDKSVFDMFIECSDRIAGSKLYEEIDIYATAESTFYERAVEEFWQDPIGGFSK